MSGETTIGWDLGGAHLKVAWLDRSGRVAGVRQLPCPLWQGEEQLRAALTQVRPELPGAAAHAVTMTGELADLFSGRAEGVRCLLSALQEALGGAPLQVYAGPDGFVDPAEAAARPEAVASMNWHATARWVAQHQRAGLLLDMGSTTTDIVSFAGGRVTAAAFDDYARLRAGELLYSGVVRTPVCAMAREVPLDGAWVPLMAELFATAADVHRLTGQLPEAADQHPAADGGPKTPEASARRLARMVGQDGAARPLAQWRALAGHLAALQRDAVVRCCRQVLSREDPEGAGVVIGAGAGRFLARAAAAELGLDYVDISALVPAAAAALRGRGAECAPAVAVAVLAHQRGARGGPDGGGNDPDPG